MTHINDPDVETGRQALSIIMTNTLKNLVQKVDNMYEQMGRFQETR